jgi:hypothetical protein
MNTNPPNASHDASDRSAAAPVKPEIVGTMLVVGLVALKPVTGGAVAEMLVTDRVDVVVFSATMLVDEKFPKGAIEVVRGRLVAPQAPVSGELVPVTVTVLVVVEVMVVVRLEVVLEESEGEEVKVELVVESVVVVVTV